MEIRRTVIAGSAKVEAASPASEPAAQANGIASPKPPISSGSAPVLVTLNTSLRVEFGPFSHSRRTENGGAALVAAESSCVKLSAALHGSLGHGPLGIGCAPFVTKEDQPALDAAPAVPAARTRMLASPRLTVPPPVKLKPSVAPARPSVLMV